MRLKKEFPLALEKEYKAFKKTFKNLTGELAKIDAVTQPLASHQIQQAIFALPHINSFGEEMYVGNLHFNDYHDLVALANAANDVETKESFFREALEQLIAAKECYGRARIPKKERERLITIVDRERQFVTNAPVEVPTASLIEDRDTISSDEQSLESVDEVLDEEVMQNQPISSFAENQSTLFYVRSVPPKKKKKFEERELSIIKPDELTSALLDDWLSLPSKGFFHA